MRAAVLLGSGNAHPCWIGYGGGRDVLEGGGSEGEGGRRGFWLPPLLPGSPYGSRRRRPKIVKRKSSCIQRHIFQIQRKSSVNYPKIHRKVDSWTTPMLGQRGRGYMLGGLRGQGMCLSIWGGGGEGAAGPPPRPNHPPVQNQKNSIAFGKSTSQRIYPKPHTP